MVAFHLFRWTLAFQLGGNKRTWLRTTTSWMRSKFVSWSCWSRLGSNSLV
jgi:hypothetical protein